jgi:7-cyano-7-deazaguanine synthase
MSNKPGFGKSCVVLLSGGLDSATALYSARKKGFSPVCLIFDYGQRHKREIASAAKISRAAGCPYKIVKISLPWQGSALLDKNLPIPVPGQRNKLKGSGAQQLSGSAGIPSTYVPARNTIFLSFALSFAETIGAEAIFIGANAIDYSGYPDCRPGFYRAFEKVISVGTKAGVERRKIRILTPLIGLTKAGIIRLGTDLGVPYELTWSCYRGEARPCGKCESCFYRALGFKQAKLQDPALRAK